MFNKIKNIEELQELNGFSDQEIKYRNSKDRLLIKKITAQYFKQKLENINKNYIDYYKCKSDCYEKQVKDEDNQDVNELKRCSQKCKQTIDELKVILDNVNYLSERKMKKCDKQCSGQLNSGFSKQQNNLYFLNRTNINDCYWICYNKLDRRYRDYWLKQKQDMISRIQYKQQNESIIDI